MRASPAPMGNHRRAGEASVAPVWQVRGFSLEIGARPQALRDRPAILVSRPGALGHRQGILRRVVIAERNSELLGDASLLENSVGGMAG